MNRHPINYVLLFQCVDQKGIVARISQSIFECGGNIVAADQYTTGPEGGHFFMRVEFVVDSIQAGLPELEAVFSSVAVQFNASWKLNDKSEPLRMGILVSRSDHCLREILYLWDIGELRIKIPFIISNQEVHRKLAGQYNIPFHFICADKENRKEGELLSLVKDKTDFLVLARYMLVFSPDFLKNYGKDMINIHHGLLPAFKGANPHLMALEEGVKVIGATAHFVDERLDEGPIIAQEVEAVSHKDGLSELVKKGRDLEKKALSRAVSSYLDYRVIRHGKKTVVF